MKNEPIAIVGMGCRFPAGASGPERFWDLLTRGVDAMGPVPPSRWDHRRFYDPDPKRPGKIYVEEAAFLREPIEAFDALAFGISPREAKYMDPQQRLLLEVAWEAFEDAGVPLESVRGGEVGVFVGGFTLDSMVTQLAYENQHLIGSHSGPGATMTMLANRLSHVFDLRGPSVSMDTACSSSLVATHFACQAIWRGECDMALVGGVNVMLRPGFPIVMCKGGFLSHHGRCMAFDERAAGYARGEGAGIAVLKPLREALADGDRIYASVLATGVNQDGRTQGISLPNRDAQATLVRRVLDEAGVPPAEVRYVEAHGTGTQAGDPAEAGALDEVLRTPDRGDEVVWLGSVKTNMGHLEAAAGIAGLLKTALALEHGSVPKNLHFERPNPKIPWDEACLRVPTSLQPLPPDAVAGVNSFGYGGANAHVVLRGVVQEEPPRRVELRWPLALPLSARDPRALRARAGQIASCLREASAEQLVDVAHTLAHRSSHHSHRAVVVAGDAPTLVRELETFASEGRSAAVADGQVPAERARLAFVFTGMGPQWWAMGRELLTHEPVFRRAVERVDAVFQPLAGWSLVEALQADEASSRIAETTVAQPANFAIQYALSALWTSWGITPDAVVGHSVGEVASACLSGALSLEDAVLVSYHRSRLQATTAGQGTMLAAGIDEATAKELCELYDGVSVAAINGAEAVTLAGEEAPLREIAASLEEEGLFQRMLTVEVAYHSHQMAPIEDELRRSLAELRPRRATLPLTSTVTGGRVDGAGIDAGYWWRNVREPVRFGDAMASLLAEGITHFVEVGPHPVLRTAIHEAMRAAGVDGQVLPSLRRHEPERARMLLTAGTLHAAGRSPRWSALLPADGRLCRLPSYPWQREVYWNESAASRARIGVAAEPATDRAPAHPLLQIPTDGAGLSFESELTEQLIPWLTDHRVAGEVIVPGAAYVETALAAAERAAQGRHVILEDLDFSRLLRLDETTPVDLRVSCDLARGTWLIASSERGRSDWSVHAEGHVVADSRTEVDGGRIDRASLSARLTVEPPSAVAGLYTRLASRGLIYGPRFQTIRSIARGPREVLAHLALEEEQEASGYRLHPALLDGALQAVVAIVGDERDGAPIVPTGIDRVELFAAPGASAWAHLEVVHHTAREVQAHLALFDDDGRVLARLTGMTLQPLPMPAAPADDHPVYGFEWRDAPLLGEEAADEDLGARKLLLIGDVADTGALAGALRSDRRSGIEVTVATWAEQPRENQTNLEVAPRCMGELAAVARGAGQVVIVLPATVGTAPDDLEAFGYGLVDLARRLGRASESGDGLAPTIQLVASLGGDGSLGPVASALFAVGRVARAEVPSLAWRCIGVPRGTSASWSAVAAELLGPNDELEVRYLDEGAELRRQGRRLVVLDEATGDEPRTERVSTREVGVVLGIDQVGALGTLHWQRIGRREPGPGEIEIRVEAVGINFKDLLKLTGQLDPRVTRDTFLGDACGMECVGEVVRTGPGVTRMSVGDRVLAAPADGSFRSYVTTSEGTATPAPRSLEPSQAALLLPYLTAWHGLMNVARLGPGDTVLIHAAAGGVGQCAVAIAQRVGARIIATAGSEDKRDHLRGQGIDHVSDSRSLAFVDDVRAWTEGRGVDVVLSALTADGLRESMRLLAPRGRFVDIGKKAFIDNDSLPLRIFNEGLTYASIDMDRMFQDDMPFCLDIVAECVRLIDEGELPPLPTQVFEPSEALDAFRTMAKGRHIGRLVLAMGDREIEARVEPEPVAEVVVADGSYLVTGALGGFGLEVARWLARQGAGRLVLVSRRGLGAPGAAEAVAALEAEGTEVVVEAADVSDRAAVAAIVDRIGHSGPPLRGVFHAAMVLADERIDELSPEALSRVLAPKARGAWHLDELTRGQPLDLFVGFSSVAVAVGNPGQAAYVMGNAYLDGLAAARRARGEPGISIQWGALSEVGVITRHRHVGDALEASGVIPLSTARALEGLGQVLRLDRGEVGLFDIDWERWTEASGAVASQSLYNEVRRSASLASSPALTLARELLLVEPERRATELASRLRGEVAALLRVDEAQIALRQPLTELGVDSLLALELVTALSARGFQISVVDLMQGPTVRGLAERQVAALANRLRGSADDLLASVDVMSEQEVEALLALLDEGEAGEALPRTSSDVAPHPDQRRAS